MQHAPHICLMCPHEQIARCHSLHVLLVQGRTPLDLLSEERKGFLEHQQAGVV